MQKNIQAIIDTEEQWKKIIINQEEINKKAKHAEEQSLEWRLKKLEEEKKWEYEMNSDELKLEMKDTFTNNRKPYEQEEQSIKAIDIEPEKQNNYNYFLQTI